MNYFNPSSMFGPNEWKPAGALGGYLAGEQMGYSQKFADDAIRDNEQSFLANMHKYEMSKKEAPAQLAEFDEREGKSKLNSRIMKTDLPFDVAMAKGASDKSKYGLDQITDAAKAEEAKGEFVNRLHEYFTKKPYQSMDPDSVQTWEEARQTGAKIGVNLSPQPTAQTWSKLAAKAQSYQESIAQKQKMAVLEETGDQARRTDRGQLAGKIHADNYLEKLRHANRMEELGLKGENAVAVAEVRAEALRPNKMEALLAQAIAKGENVPPAMINAAAEEAFQRQVAALPNVKIELMKMKPEEQANYKANAIRQIKDSFFPGWDRIPGASPGKDAVKNATATKYAPAQEDAIAAAMKKNNATREQVIAAAKAAGKL